MKNVSNIQVLRPQRKYYGVFAVNRKDPTCIYGYVENSFSMGWSKWWTNLYLAESPGRVYKRTEDWLNDFGPWKGSDEKFKEFFINAHPEKYREEMTIKEMREIYRDIIWNSEANTWLGQRAWNFCKYEIRVPVGFDVKVWRIGSKTCPVEVDLRYRTAYDSKITKYWDKWKYRNAFFFVKKLNEGKTIQDFHPSVRHVLVREALQFKDLETERCVNPNLPYKTREDNWKSDVRYERNKNLPKPLTRSERKILKKQKQNRLAAEKGSPREVRTLL